MTTSRGGSRTAPTSNTMNYEQEDFGILTDDNLYLDAMLIKQIGVSDAEIKVLRVWVPKYPLTKTSVITCARQEVQSYPPNSGIAHLIFDLRGTGDSDTPLGTHDYITDLRSIKAWAMERFGKINFGLLGFPSSENGRVHMWPLRPGSMLESYHYAAKGEELVPPTILYLSSYGNFSHTDEKRCMALAEDGYDVYGMDPYRYLLQASVKRPLTPTILWEDLRLLIQMLPAPPTIIAEPMAAGLGLLWTAGVPEVEGVIAIGRAQSGLMPKHIFDHSETKMAVYDLRTLIGKIAPRPTVLIHHEGNPMGGSEKRMKVLLKYSKEPHRLESTEKISSGLLLNLLAWMETKQDKKT